MDDTQRDARLFEFAGRDVVVYRPTDGQMMALALTRQARDNGAMFKAVRRMFAVLEACIDTDEYEQMEDELITGRARPEDFTTLLENVVNCNWDDEQSAPAEPDPEPEAPKTLDVAAQLPRRAVPRA